MGEVLKKYRTDNKMTQEFVAESLGVSRQAVSKWEQGTSETVDFNMIALAKLYGVAPEELLKDVKKCMRSRVCSRDHVIFRIAKIVKCKVDAEKMGTASPCRPALPQRFEWV